jgi:phosphoribosyl-AMP cyclohydrolase
VSNVQYRPAGADIPQDPGASAAAGPPSGPGTWTPPDGATTAALLETVRFDSAGLVAAIAQDSTGRVLMMAWMDRTALAETLATGRVVYWSRSRQSLWRKGDTSGHIQLLQRMWVDCDGDSLLLEVDQTGAACHTNRRSCFYREVQPTELHEIEAPLPD